MANSPSPSDPGTRTAVSLRVALIGGLLMLGALICLLVVIVGARLIQKSVVREAQERANHSLVATEALYQRDMESIALRMRGRLERLDRTAELDDERLSRLGADLGLDFLNARDAVGRLLASSEDAASDSLPLDRDPVLSRALEEGMVWGTLRWGAVRLEQEGGAALARRMRGPCTALTDNWKP
jgi:hypothetical protein